MRAIIVFLICLKTSVAGAPIPELSTAKQLREHWAFRKISNPQPPNVENEAWLNNPVDRFVLSSLERQGWTPSPRADKRTLIRRAQLDLTGLMPSYSDVEKFLADESPDAWDNLIKHLLASPHYGERWGRHWLDVARYADNKGYVGVGFNVNSPAGQVERRDIRPVSVDHYDTTETVISQ